MLDLPEKLEGKFRTGSGTDARRFYVFIIFIQAYALLIYPTWYAPGLNFVSKLLLFHFFFIAVGINIYLVPKIVDIDIKVIEIKLPRPKITFVVLSMVYLAGIIPFINFPVVPLLDSHFHTAFPAAAIRLINTKAQAISFGKIDGHLLVWILSTILAWAALTKRKQLRDFAEWITPTKLFILSYLPLVVYAFVVSAVRPLDSLGNLAWFHRYPPLGKTFFGLSYGLFGITNFSGRITQICFTLLTAYTLSVLAQRLPYTENHARKQTFPLLVLFLFNPFFWNIMFYNHLAMGSVFFSILPLYLIFRWRETDRDHYLLFFWAAITAGFFYKRVILFLFPTIFLYIASEFGLTIKERTQKFIKAMAVPLVVFIPYAIYDKHFQYAPTVLVTDNIWNPLNPFIPLLQLTATSGFISFALFVIGLVTAIFYLRHGLVRIYFIFTIITLVALTLTQAWMTNRNLLPVLPCLMIFASILVERVYRKFPGFATILILAVIAEMGFLNFVAADVELINSKTGDHYAVPYEELVEYIQGAKLDEAGVYAPANSEPSHFYFYKLGVSSANYERKYWASKDTQTIENLHQYLEDNDIEYVAVHTPPVERNTRFERQYWNYFKGKNPDFHQGFKNSSYFWDRVLDPMTHKILYYSAPYNGFEIHRQFGEGENKIRLLKRIKPSESAVLTEVKIIE
ncbi:MAG: glycosyltransferase family 39 protein [Candidatus Lindowbacteria bacterium]|nr:glycosyltransferase family 39 protein [Candidatus Lindowbacteria bacterium]